MDDWKRFTLQDYGNAAQHHDRIQAAAAAELGGSVEQALADLQPQTAVLTLLAGSGSRWVRSLEAAAARGSMIDFDPDKPRGLYPVPNLLPPHICSRKNVPIAAYSLAAVHGLGQHIIMTSGYEGEIETEILRPLGFAPDEYRCERQDTCAGKPLGHGAAALQTLPWWEHYSYVICTFGGDANNRRTIETSLLVLAALDAASADTGLLLPTALVDSPAYTIETDESGRPTSFQHTKLTGKAGSARRGWSNVGVRLYRTRDLAQALGFFHRAYWNSSSGYGIPENQGNELALDNADMYLADQARVRLLGIAAPQEITPAKRLEDIPGFLRAVGKLPGMLPYTVNRG